jgi:hypothetical protein
MENENVVSDQLENGSAEIKNENRVSYESLQRAVGQKKAFQQRAQEAEAKLAEIEQRNMEEQGRFKELAQQKDTEIKSLKEKVFNFGVNSFKSQLQSYAKEKNVNGASAIPKIVDEGRIIDIARSYEIGARLDSETLDALLTETMQAHNDVLSFKKAPDISDITPSKTAPRKQVKKPLSEMSESELLAALKETY